MNKYRWKIALAGNEECRKDSDDTETSFREDSNFSSMGKYHCYLHNFPPQNLAAHKNIVWGIIIVLAVGIQRKPLGLEEARLQKKRQLPHRSGSFTDEKLLEAHQVMSQFHVPRDSLASYCINVHFCFSLSCYKISLSFDGWDGRSYFYKGRQWEVNSI